MFRSRNSPEQQQQQQLAAEIRSPDAVVDLVRLALRACSCARCAYVCLFVWTGVILTVVFFLVRSQRIDGSDDMDRETVSVVVHSGDDDPQANAVSVVQRAAKNACLVRAYVVEACRCVMYFRGICCI